MLRGQLSLVGPRPISRFDYERLEPWQQRRNRVLPGITGLWQISGRDDDDYEGMARLDLFYVQRWSLFLDLEILLKTVHVTLIDGRSTLCTAADAATSARPSSSPAAGGR